MGLRGNCAKKPFHQLQRTTKLSVVLFGAFAHAPQKLIDLLDERLNERTVFVRDRGKQLWKSVSVRSTQSPSQLALGGLSLPAGGFDGGALRFHRRDGGQDRV